MKINYLNNKDILEEIHRSKNSFSSYTQPEFHQYDIILPTVEKINIRTVAEAKRAKAKRLGDAEYHRRKAAGEKVKQVDTEVDYKKIAKTDVVFRIMTYEHIPANSTRKRNPKSEADKRDRVNFPAFQHWKFDENDQLICVGKSHWQGSLDNGHFNKDHGQITPTLARRRFRAGGQRSGPHRAAPRAWRQLRHQEPHQGHPHLLPGLRGRRQALNGGYSLLPGRWRDLVLRRHRDVGLPRSARGDHQGRHGQVRHGQPDVQDQPGRAPLHRLPGVRGHFRR